MANVAHASLTGAELHEPKGADAAAAGEVYIADGAGSGSWGSVGTSSFTGAVSYFAAVIAPTGWLELNGTDISTATYSALYAVMSITKTGTRNATTLITGIDTTYLRVGFYAFGTGIAAGTTIATIGVNQITLSGAASGSGTSDIVFSPWYLDTGTIRLPDMVTAGRYLRSRTGSSLAQGQLLADQNKAHTHAVSGTTNNETQAITHAYSGTVSAESIDHTHDYVYNAVAGTATYQAGGGPAVTSLGLVPGTTAGMSTANPHAHTYSGVTSAQLTNHNHFYSTTSSSDGGTEARPLSMVLMCCVKT
jgi:hypothetical protein